MKKKLILLLPILALVASAFTPYTGPWVTSVQYNRTNMTAGPNGLKQNFAVVNTTNLNAVDGDFDGGIFVFGAITNYGMQPYGLISARTNGVLFSLTNGPLGQALISNGTNSFPTFKTLPESDLVRDFLAVGDGNTDVTTNVQAWVNYCANNGITGFVPSGTFLISQTITNPAATTKLTLYGAGRESSIFKCQVTNASAFSFGNSSYTFIDKLGFKGTASSGHAIRLVDPSFESGTYLPNFATLSNLRIEGFRGTDKDYLNNTMQACGIFAVNALECRFENIFFYGNTYGMYTYKCYTPRISRCSFDGNAVTIASAISQLDQKASINECDFVNGLTTLTTIPLISTSSYGVSSIDSGHVVVVDSSGTTITSSKLKNQYNQIVLHSPVIPSVTHNWIRTDTQNGIYVANGPANIAFNDFDPSYVAGTSTRKEIYVVQNDSRMHYFGNIVDNHFYLNGGGEHDAFIQIDSINGSYPTRGSIQNNLFGDALAAANVTLYRSGIKMVGYMANLKIDGNTFIVPGLVTISNLYNLSGTFSGSGFRMGDNSLQILSGTVTSQYSAPSSVPNMKGIVNISGLRVGYQGFLPSGADTNDYDIVYNSGNVATETPIVYINRGTYFQPAGVYNTYTNAVYVGSQGTLAGSTNFTWDGATLKARGTDYYVDNAKELRSYLSNGVTQFTMVSATSSNTLRISTPSVPTVIFDNLLMASGKTITSGTGKLLWDNVTGAGVTNISGTVSANIAAGTNIVLVTNSNGQISFNSTATSTTGAGVTNISNVLYANLNAGTNMTFVTNANGQISINTTVPGVSSARAINTSGSLSGGGDLSADRTLSLINDSASPGSTKYYGTDAGGSKGFFSIPIAGTEELFVGGDCSTTDGATPVQLLIFTGGRSFAWEVTIIADWNSGASYGAYSYRRTGMLRNNGPGFAGVVSASTPVTLNDNLTPVSVTISNVSATQGGLQITVVGEAGKTIGWRGTVRYTTL